MKILIDARFWGLENAGLGRYTQNLIKELVKIDRKNTYSVLLRDKYFRGLNFPQNWEKIRAEVKHYSLAEQVALPGIIRKAKADLIHFLHFNAPFFTPGKYIVTIHDLLMHRQKGTQATTLPPFAYFFKRAGYRMVFSKAAGGAEKVIVPSKFVKKELEKNHRLKEDSVRVIYEGLDENFSPGTSRVNLKRFGLKEGRYFVFVGNAYPHKNLKRAIEATVLLNRTAPSEVKFLIITPKGIFTERLKRDVKKAGAEKFVRITGFVEDEVLKGLYASSLGLLYPSLSEGFGLPGLEAMSSGTLAVVSDIRVFKEIYKDCAVYFNPYDFGDIQRAMMDVWEMEADERIGMVSKGLELVKKYSWNEMARETLKVYESCAGI